uniref:Uncharacterized protein n=1 Tax=Onchocerca volvulus TaxID=6282 RepID=A0A8R1XX38_ONCVO
MIMLTGKLHFFVTQFLMISVLHNLFELNYYQMFSQELFCKLLSDFFLRFIDETVSYGIAQNLFLRKMKIKNLRISMKNVRVCANINFNCRPERKKKRKNMRQR